MDNIQSDEALMVFMISHLAKHLGNNAILKGGMVLRLMDCPRYTNDLDYVFIPFKSKKEIVPLITRTLEKLPQIKIESRVHSTNAQFDIVLKNNYGTFKTQIEANVSQDCASQSLSTGDLALKFQQSPHIIRVMRTDIMLAHKLAAWNERRLIRDLYDTYFICKNMSSLPDLVTLKKRLSEISYAKRTKDKNLPKKMSLKEFLDELEKETKDLNDKDLETELGDYLDEHQLAGLVYKIRITLFEMIEKLRATP